MDFQTIRKEAAGRCGEIIAALSLLPPAVVGKGPQDHPCTVCGRESLVWPGDPHESAASSSFRSCEQRGDSDQSRSVSFGRRMDSWEMRFASPLKIQPSVPANEMDPRQREVLDA